MPMFSELDWSRLENISWDLDDLINEACDFVMYVSAIGQMAAAGSNVSVATRKVSEDTGASRPAVLNGSPDFDLCHWR